MSCQYCGSDISTDETTCPVCGMSVVEQPALAPAGPQHWEPGPSFVDIPNHQLDREGIPGWLETFGETIATRAALAAQAPAAPASGTNHVRGEPILPSWLEEPRSLPGTSPQPAGLLDDVISTDDSASFISEDDLPEWLRSIADEPAMDEFAAVGAAATGVNGVFTVPSISVAWVTSQHMVALAPGATLFARIAGEDAAPVSVSMPEPPHHVEVPAISAAANVDEQPTTTGSRNSMRIFLLVALIMVVILVVLVTLTQS